MGLPGRCHSAWISRGWCTQAVRKELKPVATPREIILQGGKLPPLPAAPSHPRLLTQRETFFFPTQKVVWASRRVRQMRLLRHVLITKYFIQLQKYLLHSLGPPPPAAWVSRWILEWPLEHAAPCRSPPCARVPGMFPGKRTSSHVGKVTATACKQRRWRF